MKGFSMAMIEMKVVGELPAAADAVAVGVFEKTEKLSGWMKDVDAAVKGALSRALALKDFKGKAGSAAMIPVEGGLKRLMLVGLGKREAFDLDQLRWAAGSAAKAARGAKLKRVAMCLHGDVPADAARAGQALAEGAIMGGFVFREYKKRDDEKGDDGAMSFLVLEKGKRAAVAEGIRVGSVIGEAANEVRTIACRPGNVINPRTLVAEARRVAARNKLKLTVIDAGKAKSLGMGGLGGVGQGSENPPAMIVLEYSGPGAKGAPIAVVGKAVTFDTGGISIKPAAEMDNMKYDKCGGVAVLGVMTAAARLKLPIRLVGVIPTAENVISAAAYRPGDILRMHNGKTVEITNTDAEGRLILGDALSYAAEKYKPQAMVNMATLTGGCVIALGGVYAGMFANDDALARELDEAGRAAGELLWRLPLHERYKPAMDGYHADLQNAGGREASPITAAIFLEHFVPPGVKWAHLDIAGTAYSKRDDRYLSKGATAFGVRVLVEWLRRRAK